jgi:putative intracellular protease/amidase
LRISPAHAALLKGTKSTADVALDPYHAVFLVRGQSPMVTTINDEALHAFIARPYESGRIVAIVVMAPAMVESGKPQFVCRLDGIKPHKRHSPGSARMTQRQPLTVPSHARGSAARHG